jgi:predicted transposase YdaD
VPSTDSPLKQLLELSITDFAAWLLASEVREAYPLNVEFQTEAVRVDQLYHVTLDSGQATLLHIEFQGKSTHRPMKWRMLDYMARIAATERDLDLSSVVFYVGYGSGVRDSGSYQVNSPDGSVSLTWHYRVIRLWELEAETVLALGRPGLLPLIGQTRINEPERLFPQVIQQLQSTTDAEQQTRLLTTLLALVHDEEMANMVEKLIETEGVLLDTPFLRRIRQESREEGREEGQLSARRQSILDILVLRFNLAVPVYRAIEKVLSTVSDEAELEKLLAAAVTAQEVVEFQAALPKSNS